MMQVPAQARLWRRLSLCISAVLVTLAVPAPGFSPGHGTIQAQTDGAAQVFKETGKAVRGRFLTYWVENGALAQFGYPISDEMQEQSVVDGKAYTVQYFERAVFELHPHNRPPYDVLLRLLGTLMYKERYPNGAGSASHSGQQPSADPAARPFPQTGKRLGGRFLSYWRETGGLMRHGYPISDEFREISLLDGKTYTVQYFERSVFELHPQNKPPYDVLLSQLGTFAWKQKVELFRGLGTWKLWDPMDPAAPSLIEPSDKGYRLKPGWEVASIEYIYQWTGLGDNILNYQKVEQRGGEYVRDGAAIPAELVQAFLHSLDRLYPTHGLVTGRAGFDDYPYWAVEIVGADGNHVFISSTSNRNPGNGPWNVLYNGRMYAQYDGSLAAPLGQLFPTERSSPWATTSPGGAQPGAINFVGGSNYPKQVTSGFWGMFPFPDSFEYELDSARGTITGHLTAQSLTTPEIGLITELRSVTLTAGGKQVLCNMDRQESSGWSLYWDFSCNLERATPGEAYRYPIELRIGTNTGREMVVTGELWGVWGLDRRFIHAPVAIELRGPISRNRDITDLLSDHVLLQTGYSGWLYPDNPTGGMRDGEAILAGTTTVDGRPIRYTVGTRFQMEGGELKYWTLDRTALRSFLGRIASLPLTRRLARADPDLAINLWYAAAPLPTPRAGVTDRYAMRLNPCGSIPGGIFPSDGHPLQAFHYNQSSSGPAPRPYFSFAQQGFVLVNGRPAVAVLHLSPLLDRDPVMKALLPSAFDTGSARLFDRVWIDARPDRRSTSLTNGQITLTLESPTGPTPEERAVYDRIAASLPGVTTRRDGEGQYRLEKQMLTFAVQDTGELGVVGCQR